MSSSSGKLVNWWACGTAEALAYTPSQNCCSLSKVYETSNSIAQVFSIMVEW